MARETSTINASMDLEGASGSDVKGADSSAINESSERLAISVKKSSEMISKTFVIGRSRSDPETARRMLPLLEESLKCSFTLFYLILFCFIKIKFSQFRFISTCFVDFCID